MRKSSGCVRGVENDEKLFAALLNTRIEAVRFDLNEKRLRNPCAVDSLGVSDCSGNSVTFSLVNSSGWSSAQSSGGGDTTRDLLSRIVGVLGPLHDEIEAVSSSKEGSDSEEEEFTEREQESLSSKSSGGPSNTDNAALDEHLEKETGSLSINELKIKAESSTFSSTINKLPDTGVLDSGGVRST